MTTRSLSPLLSVLLLLVSCTLQAAEIIIAASSLSPSLHGFAATLQQRNDKVRLISATELEQLRPAADSRLILLGEPLLAWRLEHPDAPPSLILQVSRVQAQQHLQGRQIPRGITLLWSDPPVERQLGLIRELLPHARRVGVLLGPQSLQLREELETAARHQQLQLQSQQWDDTRDSRALIQLLDRSDVLLGIDDPQLFNPLTIKQILLASYDQRKALIGPTATFIRAGSLSSTYSNQEDWLASLQLLLDLPPTQWPASAYPKYFHVTSNSSVARSLGVEHYDDDALAGQLQQRERP